MGCRDLYAKVHVFLQTLTFVTTCLQRSREDASNMMDLVKPKLLFLELDKTREHYLQAVRFHHLSINKIFFKVFNLSLLIYYCRIITASKQ